VSIVTFKLEMLRTAPYFAVLTPLVIAVILAAGTKYVRRIAPWFALVGPGTALAVGIIASGGQGTSGSLAWLSAGGTTLSLGWSADGLSAVMLIVIGVVASMVMVFSAGYMAEERGLVRYYAFLSLFTAAMAGLVLASDLVGLFLSWELVGVCSFLLIGFWYDKPAAAEAARKAFLVTRVGDTGLLLAMGLLWSTTGTLNISEVLAKAGDLAPAAVTAVALLLFLGAAGKSAQFPLHAWLPDAMEGPTPVSALIHAATMVAAGVFLVARMWPVFEAAPAALTVMLWIGTFTAIAAATIAVTQTDIKKVLAYSTISQLGFMFAALGAGAWGAALFHLVTHAAFKALLFLGSGSVIHGAGTQDLREMGGLARKMPITAATWLAGALALAGVPPLAGFFSKDAVIASVLHASPFAGYTLVAASVLTGFYVARTTQLAFFGTSRGDGHAHESPLVMTGPLVVLALLAVGAGFGGGWIASVLGAEHEALSIPVAVTSSIAALVGLMAGGLSWASDPAVENTLPKWAERAWRVARGGYGWDAFVQRTVVLPTVSLAMLAYAFVDRIVIDGIVEGSGRAAKALGSWLSELQNGDVQWYSALVAAGGVLAVTLAWWLGR
jgi:NADH-quinone oxidoreductase subunit L